MIEYSIPTTQEAITIVRNRLSPFDTNSVRWQIIEAEFSGLSHAELARMSDDAAKTAILRQTKKVLHDDLRGALHSIKANNYLHSKMTIKEVEDGRSGWRETR